MFHGCPAVPSVPSCSVSGNIAFCFGRHRLRGSSTRRIFLRKGLAPRSGWSWIPTNALHLGFISIASFAERVPDLHAVPTSCHFFSSCGLEAKVNRKYASECTEALCSLA